MNLQLQELNFTLSIEDFNPTILDLNTLQNGGIIKSDWQLVEEPIYNSSVIKLVFSNKVRIIAQQNRIIFAETIGKKRLQDSLLPQIIQNLIKVFSTLKYQGISLNPGAYAPFDSNLDACHYMSKGLLAATPWKQFQGREMSAVGLKLAYPYKTGNFYLEINQANVEIANRETAAVWFAGNFSYQLLGSDSMAKNIHLKEIIRDWQFDVKNFQEFIDRELLAVSLMPSVSLFPL